MSQRLLIQRMTRASETRATNKMMEKADIFEKILNTQLWFDKMTYPYTAKNYTKKTPFMGHASG